MAKKDSYQLRQEAESSWKNDPKIRAEFESMESLFHYLKAKESGLVKFAPSTVR